MKKTLLAILGVLVVAIVGLVGFASTKPDAYHVERMRDRLRISLG